MQLWGVLATGSWRPCSWVRCDGRGSESDRYELWLGAGQRPEGLEYLLKVRASAHIHSKQPSAKCQFAPTLKCSVVCCASGLWPAICCRGWSLVALRASLGCAKCPMQQGSTTASDIRQSTALALQAGWLVQGLSALLNAPHTLSKPQMSSRSSSRRPCGELHDRLHTRPSQSTAISQRSMCSQ